MSTGYLLDTHVLLWWLTDPGQLADQTHEVIADGAHAVLVSAAAVWEMSIKRALGRLDFPANLEDVLAVEEITVLPITLPHALAIGTLPLHHQDPFDRMQVAQARVEGLMLVTRDPAMGRYDIDVLPA